MREATLQETMFKLTRQMDDLQLHRIRTELAVYNLRARFQQMEDAPYSIPKVVSMLDAIIRVIESD